jgi:hypothetical protein
MHRPINMVHHRAWTVLITPPSSSIFINNYNTIVNTPECAIPADMYFIYFYFFVCILPAYRFHCLVLSVRNIAAASRSFFERSIHYDLNLLIILYIFILQYSSAACLSF